MEDHDQTDPSEPSGSAPPGWMSPSQGLTEEAITLQLVDTSSRPRPLAVGTALVVLVGLLGLLATG